MKLTVQRGSKLVNPSVDVFDVSFVVFSDNEGNPIGIAEHLSEAVVQFTTCQEEGFAMLLQRLGIQATMPHVEVRRQ